MMFAQTTGQLWILLAAFLWSLIGIFSKNCLDAGLSPQEIAFWRAALGALCFLLHAVYRGELPRSWRHAACFLLFGFWGIGVFFGALQYAIQRSGAATAMMLLYTAPVWVAVFSRLFFDEKLSPRKILAILVASWGTALLCVSGGSIPGQTSLPGILCGLLAGLCYATHYPFCRWWQRFYSTSAIYALMLTGGTLALGLWQPRLFVHSAQTWFWLIMLGVVSTFFAYLAYGMALKQISLVRAAVTCQLEPVLGTLWVCLLWQENFTFQGWLGCGLILLSVLWLTISQEKGSAVAERSHPRA